MILLQQLLKGFQNLTWAQACRIHSWNWLKTFFFGLQYWFFLLAGSMEQIPKFTVAWGNYDMWTKKRKCRDMVMIMCILKLCFYNFQVLACKSWNQDIYETCQFMYKFIFYGISVSRSTYGLLIPTLTTIDIVNLISIRSQN